PLKRNRRHGRCAHYHRKAKKGPPPMTLPIRNSKCEIHNSLSRRDWLRLTAAGIGSVSASGWLSVLASHAAHEAAQGVRHKSCILLYMSGGPSHIDTFDLKHDSETGTEFRPIATSVPGIQISEHLPRLARLMHHG